jgi:hypothetical protein
MAMGLKLGKTGVLDTLENSIKEKRMERGDLNGKMGLFMKEIL